MSRDGEAEANLRHIGATPDAPFDLARAALALATFERPRVGLDRYHRHLDELAGDVAAAAVAATTPEARLEALNATLIGAHGYTGDELNYDDMQNANLMRVIDRRKGLPVALGILYIHAARAQGWTMAGLAFPGHFLLRFGGGDGRLVIDPFHCGSILAPQDLRDRLKAMQGNDAELKPEHYAEVSDRSILLRLQNNINLRLQQQNDFEAAGAVVARMLMIAPDTAPLWREAGILNARAGKLRAAIEAIERYRDLETAPTARHEAAALLRRMRDQLN